jgi:glycosyltransferase involved in cell wall biosynthesis
VAQHTKDETVDGVRINPVREPESRRERMTRTARSVCRAALAENADLYHFHDPELIPVGIWLKLRGKRVIYDVHEDVPQQILSKPWIANWLKRPVSMGAEVAESSAARLFDGIVAATPEIARRFPKHKTVTTQNFPPLGELDQCVTIPYQERPHEVAYLGSISAYRGATELVHALERLPDGLEVQLLMAGSVYPESYLKELSDMPGWSRVQFLGWQSRSGVARILGRARIGLVTIHPLVNYLHSWPTKLFEYMAAGIPVIASDLPRCRQIVEESHCGLLVDPLDVKSIADALQWLLERPTEAEDMGKRGRDAFRKKYNWTPEAQRLVAFYRDVIR